MNWVLEEKRREDEEKKGLFWVELTSYDHFQLEKRVAMVSGGELPEENTGNPSAAQFRVVSCCGLSSMDRAILDSVKLVEIRSLSSPLSFSSDLPPAPRTPSERKKKSTSIFMKFTKKKEENSTKKIPLTDLERSSKSLSALDNYFPDMFIIYSSRELPEILPVWRMLISLVINKEKGVTNITPIASLIRLAAHRYQVDVKSIKMKITLDHHLSETAYLDEWNCLKPRGRRPSSFLERSPKQEEIFTACEARMVRVVDEKSFSGVLIVTSSHVSFLVEEELKEPPLCKRRTKKEKEKAGNVTEEERMQALSDVINQLEKKHNRIPIPFLSVMALWQNHCDCSENCSNDIISIQTVISKYSIVLTSASASKQASIGYLIDQLWRWVMVLTLQRAKDTFDTFGLERNKSISVRDLKKISKEEDEEKKYDTDILPFYNIPFEPTECVVNTPCICWENYVYFPGQLKATHDGLIFQSDAAIDLMSSSQTQRGEPLVFSIQFPTITEIMLPNPIPAISERERAHLIQISTIRGKKFLFQVEQGDSILLLFQLWAVSIRSPHFRHEGPSLMTPPSLTLCETTLSKSCSLSFFGGQQLNSKILLRADVHVDMWRDIHFLQSIASGISDLQRPFIWQVISGSLSKYSDSIAHSQRQCLLRYVPEIISRENYYLPQGIVKKLGSTYEDYLSNARKNHKKHFMGEIEKDLYRSFPEHPMFQEDEGIASLRRVLVAFGIRNPSIGYCQSMNILAAFLLCWMDEQNAFWLLCVITENLMIDYFNASMTGACLDQKVLQDLVAELLPGLNDHLLLLGSQNLLPVVTTQWFLCLFIQCLPWPVVLRILDNFFAIGIHYLFQTTLGLLEYYSNAILEMEDSAEVLILLRSCEEVEVEELFRCIEKFRLSVTSSVIKELRSVHRPELLNHIENTIDEKSENDAEMEDQSMTKEEEQQLKVKEDKPLKSKKSKLASISVPSLANINRAGKTDVIQQQQKKLTPTTPLGVSPVGKFQSREKSVRHRSLSSEVDTTEARGAITRGETLQLFHIADNLRHGRFEKASGRGSGSFSARKSSGSSPRWDIEELKDFSPSLSRSRAATTYERSRLQDSSPTFEKDKKEQKGGNEENEAQVREEKKGEAKRNLNKTP